MTEFSHYITHSENDPYYFIFLLDHYAKCRPAQPDVAISLKNCLYNSFPKLNNAFTQYIKKSTHFLKYIIFPKDNSSPLNDAFKCIQTDNIEGLIEFFSSHPEIDISQSSEPVKSQFSYLLPERSEFSLFDACYLFGALKCFKYLLLMVAKLQTHIRILQLPEEIKKLSTS